MAVQISIEKNQEGSGDDITTTYFVDDGVTTVGYLTADNCDTVVSDENASLAFWTQYSIDRQIEILIALKDYLKEHPLSKM